MKNTRPQPDIPDYALDKRTQKGYELRRKFEHFITEGSQLIQLDAVKILEADKDYQTKAEALLRSGKKK